MGIDKDRVTTQDDLAEAAPIDQVEGRVEAQMKKIEGTAKKNVAEGLQNSELAHEGDKLQKEGDRELAEETRKSS